MLIQTAGCRHRGLARGLREPLDMAQKLKHRGCGGLAAEPEWHDPASQDPSLCRPPPGGFHTQWTALWEHAAMTVDWRARETPISYRLSFLHRRKCHYTPAADKVGSSYKEGVWQVFQEVESYTWSLQVTVDSRYCPSLG